MGSFDANTDFREGLDHRSGIFGVEVARVLLKVAQHPLVDDVDIGQDARLGAVDHRLLEVAQVTRPGCARINHSRHATAEGVGVGIHAQAFRFAFWRTRMIDVDVDVENAGGDNVTADINDFGRQGRVDVVRHRGDLVALNRHIPHCIYSVVRVNEMTAFE